MKKTDCLRGLFFAGNFIISQFGKKYNACQNFSRSAVRQKDNRPAEKGSAAGFPPLPLDGNRNLCYNKLDIRISRNAILKEENDHA